MKGFIFGNTRRLQRRAEWLASQTFVVLAIQVPKDNEKTPQSAEQFFASLHGIYRNDPVVQEHVSFEIVASKDSITFYVFTPLHLRDFIEGQLYAQYPDLVIKQVPDYTKQVHLEGKHVASTQILLTKEEVYPIKTFASSEVDPLAGITAVLSGLEEQEQVWFQIVARPIGDEWQSKGTSYVQALRTGKMPSAASGLMGKAIRFFTRVLQEVFQPGSGVGEIATASKEPPKLSAPQEAALKGIESKATKLGFETVFRLVVVSQNEISCKSRVQAMLAALKQFNTTNLNGFKSGEVKVDDFSMWQKYISREFEEKGYILNIEELASIYHFPSKAVETSAISWAGSKKGEAPFNLPIKDVIEPHDLTLLGKTDFRNSSKEFGIKLDDRRRHIYVIGKSGTGKSTLLENMAIDDVRQGRGVIIVDPHGELADKIVDSIPENRIQDVVILDPADREFPIAFNLLESVGDDFKGMVASGFVGIFKKIFGYSWGPRLEYILRNTVLALLDTENATMLGIPRMLTEQGFRDQVVAQVKDPVIRDFWVNEFSGMDARQRSEAVAPILNKVGQFLSTSTIRNIVGQPHSTIDIRRIMDEEKILVVNLSKGKIGEDNMALLGAMMITKVQLSAMSRANVAADQRPDCFLYVDEFQNFATESFATILSEARKYNLGLTIAHQYIAQMSEEVKDAVIGNVGTLVSFRVGGPDAEVLVKEFAPVFDAQDLVNLERAHIYIKLLVDGLAAAAFSAQTFPPVKIDESFRERVVGYSRQQYARSRSEVEQTIDETAGYKLKREAETASKQAQEILKAGESLALPTVGSPAPSLAHPAVAASLPRPAVPAAALPAAPPTVVRIGRAAEVQVAKPEVQPVAPEEPVAQENSVARAETAAEEGSEPKPRKEKPLKAMDGWVYKEVSQKGGMKWYFAEKEEEVMARLEEKRLQREQRLAAKNEQPEGEEAVFEAPADPLPSPPPSEHIPNEEPQPAAAETPVEPVPAQEEVSDEPELVALREGQSLSL